MRHFRSQDLPARARVRLANRAISDWYGARLMWEADDAVDFNVEMSLTNLGHSMFSVHRSTGGRMINRPDAPDSASTCVIHAALRGPQRLEIGGAQVRLEEGEYTCVHATSSFMRHAGDDVLVGSLAVPLDLLRRYVKHPELVLGRVFPGHGLAGSISSMLRSMLEMEQARTLGDFGGRLPLYVLDLLGLYSRTQRDEGDNDGAGDDRVRRIKAYVLSNIHAPDLSVASVSEHFQLSCRYIHMLFARENATLSGFIREERLERCRAELENGDARSRSISDLAYGWGFNDLSHFCRTFRRAYGVSARDYRNRALELRGGEPPQRLI